MMSPAWRAAESQPGWAWRTARRTVRRRPPSFPACWSGRRRRPRRTKQATPLEGSHYLAKKRVYELAKDLGLSNKEMVEWLHGHEYDVKSHSSSLEDDQAQAVIEKFKGEKAPKPVAAKPASSGVVLRRKRADTAAEHEHEAAAAAEKVE